MAHAELVSSDPADGAQLAESPTTITLTFSEGLEADRSSIRLNRDGQTLASGGAARNGDTTMAITGLALEPGDYVIRWVSSADDGHLERGRVDFTVLAPVPSATPARSPTSRPSDAGVESPAPTATTPTPTAALTPSAAPSPDPGAAGSTTGGDVLLPILAALVLVGGAGAFLLRRSRRA